MCELDIVFAWDKTMQVSASCPVDALFSLAHCCVKILDEIVTGGLVAETNTHEILIALKEQ